MDHFDSMVRRQRKGMLYLLVLVVLGTVFFPSRESNGLLLGGVISFYNLWLLQRKTKVLGDKATKSGGSPSGLGTISRMAAAVLGAAIALRYVETFHIIAVVIGIMLSYLIIFIDGIYYFLIRKSR